MITVENNYFKIDTPNTTYLFKVNPLGLLEHIYYGKYIPNEEDYSFLEEMPGFGYGIEKEDASYHFHPNHSSNEVSFRGRGDNRELILEIEKDDDPECEFFYKGYDIINDFSIPGLPNALNKEATLVIHLYDSKKKLEFNLYYSTYKGNDVITKSTSLKNNDNKPITIRRILSSQLDIAKDDFILKTLDGLWAKERYIHAREVGYGVTKIGAQCGFSSSEHNPFILLEEKGTTLNSGDCYGLNLIYSGNHVEYIERSNVHKVRLLNGINDSSFAWLLSENEEFYSPEATLCFSSKGENELTHQYHRFINENIVRGYWQNRDHPVLLNGWEALTFTFNEEKLLKIAKRAKDLGFELFVLDDGWFGKRNGEKSSLGDWFPNLEKLPEGIKGLSKKVHDLGLLFGLWYEPEMISKDSDLFRKHPEFVLRHPDYEPLTMRFQYMLDLANPTVVDYLIETLSKSFNEGNLDYVKWDCNRVLSDCYSTYSKLQGETAHRYMLGLYRLLDTLTKRFPKILFESCASGGRRSDLGMLAYMPSFWCSDDTEPYERMKIQEGTLLAYPQSTIGAHVSDSPNKQTLRSSEIEDRFNVAMIGAFGYELDVTELSDIDTLSLIEEIAWYKENRHLLAYGDYYLTSSIFFDNYQSFYIVNPNKEEAIYFLGKKLFEFNSETIFAKVANLDPKETYLFKERRQNFDFYLERKRKLDNRKTEDFETFMANIKEIKPLTSEEQIVTLKGESLMNAGVRLYYEWGSGHLPKRIMTDFGTRVYKITKC